MDFPQKGRGKSPRKKIRILKSLRKSPQPLWRLFPGREFREHSNNFGIHGKNEFLELPRAQPPWDPCGYFGIFPTKFRPKPSEFHMIPENLSLAGEKKTQIPIFRWIFHGKWTQGRFQVNFSLSIPSRNSARAGISGVETIPKQKSPKFGLILNFSLFLEGFPS